jgi:hypothetical protein
MGSSTAVPGVDFSAREGEAAADEQIAAIASRLREKLESDIKLAEEHACEYAKHLESGGDPLVFPKVGWSEGRDALLSPKTGLVAVYRLWNEKRGGRHGIVPMIDGTGEWKLAEKLCASLGAPVLYADLKHLPGIGSSSSSVERVIRKMIETTEGKLVGRRTEVGSKVAFLVREPRDGDAEQESRGGQLPFEAAA